MKKENLRIFLFCLITFIGFNMLVQTAYAEIKKAILGKWVTIGSAETIEFFEDGTIIFEAKMEGEDKTIIGDYRFLNQSRIRIDFHGIFEIGGPQVTRISIDNDKLILNNLLDERIELKKMTEAMQIYLDGLALYEKEKFNEAANLFEKAAKLGESEALMRLGFMFYNGTGVEKNYQNAFKWYLEAAKQGVAPAQRFLGFMYRKGNGTKKNIEKSILWAKKAADQGDVLAQNNLAWIYATSENPKYRNGELSLKYAKMAYSQKKDKWYIVGTLAAAHARVGQFDKAASTYKKAMGLLRWDNDISSDKKKKKLEEAKILLSLYQSGQAYDEGYDLGEAAVKRKEKQEKEKEAKKKYEAELKRQKAERIKKEYEKKERERMRIAALKKSSIEPLRIIEKFTFEWHNPHEFPYYKLVEGTITNVSIKCKWYTKSKRDTKWRPPYEQTKNFRDIYSITTGKIKHGTDYFIKFDEYHGTFWSKDKKEIEDFFNILSAAVSDWNNEYKEVIPKKMLKLDNRLNTLLEEEVVKPAEKENTKPQSAIQSAADAEKILVANIQQELKKQGYYKMKVDGQYGPGTAAAIKAYQQDNNLTPDGKPSKALLAHLESKKETSNKPVQTVETKKNKEPKTFEATINKAVDDIFKVIFKNK